MKKRLSAFILAAALIVQMGSGVFAADVADGTTEQTASAVSTVQSANADAISGSCGENVTWYFDDVSCQLVVEGTGDMDDYYGRLPGWDGIRDQIESIVIRDGVTSIGEEAFKECLNLTKAQIADSVKRINSRAFYNCPKLQTVEKSANTIVANDAFSGTPYGENKTFGTVEDSNIIWTFDSDTGTLTVSGSGSVPDGFDGEPWSEFRDEIKTVVFGDSITEIGGYAFTRCTNLTDIQLSESIRIIREQAFGYCTSLTAVTIPDTVTLIESEAFGDCDKLESVTVSPSTKLDGRPFARTPYEASQAPTSGVDGINTTWSFDRDTGCLTITGQGEMDGENLTRPWDELASLITSVVIEDGVTSIKSYAFENCVNLQSVVIAESVEKIGNKAFCNCSSLTEITLPSKLQSIEYDLFSGCTSLEEIVIPDDVTEIGNFAFKNCTSLSDITFGTKITSIGEGAFNGTAWLENQRDWVIISGVLLKYKGADESVVIPDGIATISERAFEDVASLKKVSIPSSVKTIGYSAFWGCSSLEEVGLTEGLVTIGMYAFRTCSSLNKIVIPDTVTDIDVGAFKGCSNLSDITIPAGVSLAKDAFDGTAWMENQGDFAVLCGHLIRYQGNDESITIPEGTQIIGSEVFRENTTLKQVSIPSSVTEIQYDAFCGCSGLSSITIPSSVTKIGNSAFADCTSLSEVSILGEPEIGTYAFRGTPYMQDNLPVSGTCGIDGDNLTWSYQDGILTISGTGQMEFEASTDAWEYYADEITSIIVEEGVTSICYMAFRDCIKLETVLLPNTLEELDAQCFLGCTSLEEISIPENVTEIGYNVFGRCTSLRTVNLPSTLTKIGQEAFAQCSSLEEITLPDDLLQIGLAAFKDCTQLQNITVPEQVREIAEEAFENCTSLTEVIIQGSETGIQRQAFQGCTALQSVQFTYGSQARNARMMRSAPAQTSRSVSIAAGVFNGCTNLESVTLPANLEAIDDNTFENCSSLSEIEIPESTTDIGMSAFSGSGLQTADVPVSVESIKAGAFGSCEALEKITIRNATCAICNDPSTISETAVIYGYLDSTAQTYAEKYDREFVALDEEEPHQHSYGEPVFTWNEDNTASASITCSECGDTQTKDCTVSKKTENGTTTYTAEVEFNGTTYTDSKTVTESVPSTPIKPVNPFYSIINWLKNLLHWFG